MLPEVGDSYPSRDVLEMLYEDGVPITIGSDCHQIERVGDGVERAMKLLYDIGFRELMIFRNKVGDTVPLTQELVSARASHG